MSRFNLDPKANYVLASTFGPDSMALLDMVQKDGISPVVLFVNYNTEDSITEEEKLMRAYCEEKNLRLEVMDCTGVSEEGKAEDFAKWSRKVRYAFFEEMYKKYNAAALLLSHNIEDQLEVYLVQKRYGKRSEKYGYEALTSYKDMIVFRPLLEFSRHDLLMYDKDNDVPYSEHMDRYENQHVRDEIQRNYIAKLNSIERDQILEEMRRDNDEKIRTMKTIRNQINKVRSLSIRSIIALDYEEFSSVLINFVDSTGVHAHLTPAKIKEIRAVCLDVKPNLSYKVLPDLFVEKQYDVLVLSHDSKTLPYTYVLEKPCVLETAQFHLDFSSGAEDRGIREEDYPLTIRTPMPQDNYAYHGHLVPLSRLLLEICSDQRLADLWPVFVNKDGKIVYIPTINEHQEEYKSKLELHLLDND